ncbi:MAG: leucyl/phenylalanyl-tRNA--protein transferase [Bacteroidia bacterium]|nr:leucyl/phenylalanyl-tRNA--protein transferase [Bacteroidia bacterium]
MIKNSIFPYPSLANEEGLLAYGGNLQTDTLLQAYSSGIFPWYSEGNPIMWWSPDPRLVLFPNRFKVSKSLMRIIKNQKFSIKFDTQFEKVITYCRKIKRNGQESTWITGDMLDAYCRLHEEGYAHSVEAYYKNELAGGLYGVSLGRAFFGESMFHTVTDASKVALFYMVEAIKKWKFVFIDAQVFTEHLVRMGANTIPRDEFLKLLNKAMRYETKRGKWTDKL